MGWWCRKYVIKLLLLIPSGGFIYLRYYPVERQTEILTANTMVFTAMLLRFFPVLSEMSHRKPIYYENLYVRGATEQDAAKYQRMFINIIQVILILVAGLVTEWAMYQSKLTRPVSIAEIAAFTGGMLSLFKTIQNNVGRLLLRILFLRKRGQSRIEVELSNVSETDVEGGDHTRRDS